MATRDLTSSRCQSGSAFHLALVQALKSVLAQMATQYELLQSREFFCLQRLSMGQVASEVREGWQGCSLLQDESIHVQHPELSEPGCCRCRCKLNGSPSIITLLLILSAHCFSSQAGCKLQVSEHKNDRARIDKLK